MCSTSTSSYHVLPQMSEDADDTSTHSHLLSSPVTTVNIPNTASITIHALLTIRILSTVLTITSFVIFVIDGGDSFIAADIFLALLMIHNTLLIIHYSISHIFKITVELRNVSQSGSWRHNVGNTERKLKTTVYFDVGLSICLTICLIIGNASQNIWYGGAWKAAVVLGYFVVMLQALLAVPALENKSLTLTAKLNDLQGKPRLDMNVLVPEHSAAAGSADVGSATRRVDAGPTGEDLV